MKYNLMSRDNLIVPNMEDGASIEGSGGGNPTEGTPAAPLNTSLIGTPTPSTTSSSESEA